MFHRVRQRYPLFSTVLLSLPLPLLFLPLSALYPENRALPMSSAVAFSLAIGLVCFPLLDALALEHTQRTSAPLWRLRYGAVMAGFWFVATSIQRGTGFPSTDAFIWVLGATFFGAFMAFVVPVRPDYALPDLFDTDTPIWATRVGDLVWRSWGFVIIAVVLGVSLFEVGGTAAAVFMMILAIGLVEPYPIRNSTRWREGDLLRVAAMALLFAGLFLA